MPLMFILNLLQYLGKMSLGCTAIMGIIIDTVRSKFCFDKRYQ